jgi:hypothetical protein
LAATSPPRPSDRRCDVDSVRPTPTSSAGQTHPAGLRSWQLGGSFRSSGSWLRTRSQCHEAPDPDSALWAIQEGSKYVLARYPTTAASTNALSPAFAVQPPRPRRMPQCTTCRNQTGQSSTQRPAPGRPGAGQNREAGVMGALRRRRAVRSRRVIPYSNTRRRHRSPVQGHWRRWRRSAAATAPGSRTHKPARKPPRFWIPQQEARQAQVAQELAGWLRRAPPNDAVEPEPQERDGNGSVERDITGTNP